MPRESAGSRSSNRFDYQKSWALCELLELHQSEDDYLLVFEHHEDLVVLNSSSLPTSAKFYQVKSKSNGNWTLNSLCKNSPKPTDLSILGKLFSNYERFDDSVEELVFVSNRGMSNKLNCGQRGVIYECVEFSQLLTQDKQNVWESVKGENNNFCDIHALSKIKILKSPLQPEDHVTTSKGRLADFFHWRYPHQPVKVSLAHQTISDEIKRKSNYELVPRNPAELSLSKAISRQEFESILSVVSQSKTSDDIWLEASQALTSEGFNFVKHRKIKREWQMYAIERMDASNEYIQLFRRTVREFVVDAIEKESFTTLSDLLIKSLAHVKTASVGQDLTDEFIKAASIYELLIHDQLPKTDSKFEGQAK